MNSTKPYVTVKSGTRRLRHWLPLAAIVLTGSAWAECPGGNHDVPISCTPTTMPDECSYAAKPGTTIITDPADPLYISNKISVTGDSASGPVYWALSASPPCNLSSDSSSVECFGMVFTLPSGAPDNAVQQTEFVTLTGTSTSGTSPPNGGESQFTLYVTDASDGDRTCSRVYKPRITSTGGGWGDPHITTVDGVHYDFQGAGEFVALRGKGIEIQTRQTPVATASVPSFTNPYTGLQSCVSLYTAVAARVGSHRVTYQPNINGKPDPSGMQLRVDGVLTTLGPDGITLVDGEGGAPSAALTHAVVAQTGVNRIVKSPEGDGMEIHYANGTKLVVTPAWWAAQQKWYLNVNVYETTASQGIMGQIAQDSWLPALADGNSVGPKPDSIHDRYQQLYEKFGNSWRVANATSLFDYAPGTSTATFTLASWPRENPNSCSLEGQPEAQAIDIATAEKECSGVVDENTKANCVFDVAVTGETGFARTYMLSEQLAAGATKTTLVADKASSKQGESVTFTATVAHTVQRANDGTPSGNVQFIVDGRNAGNPVTIDTNGKAMWTTSSLQAGEHHIVAKYNPARGFGEQFLASTSPSVSLTVAATPAIPLWLLILLIIIILAIIIWRFLRGK